MRLVRYAYPASRNLGPFWGGAARSPWLGLETEIDRLFENTLGHSDDAARASRFTTDLFEDKDNTYVRAELPGVNRDDINVEMADGYLTISAVRKLPAADGKAEESFSFSRSVALNDAVESDKVGAAYENGILTVTLPKREEVKPKKITVTVK